MIFGPFWAYDSSSLRMDFFTSAFQLGRCKETALPSCSTNYSYVWQWYWEAATVQKSPLLLCMVPAHKI